MSLLGKCLVLFGGLAAGLMGASVEAVDSARCAALGSSLSRERRTAGSQQTCRRDVLSSKSAAPVSPLLRLRGGAKDKDMHKWVMQQATSQVGLLRPEHCVRHAAASEQMAVLP